MTEHASCCFFFFFFFFFFCGQITSGRSRSALTYLCTSCVFFPVVLALRQRNHLLSCFTVHSCFSRGKIVQGTSFSLNFTFFMFFFSVNSTFRFAIFSCLTGLKHSTSLSAMFVYIRKPPNNPINACAPRLSPRLSLFYEVSYKK